MRGWRLRLHTALARASAALAARGQSLEALLGLALVTLGVGLWSVPAACIVSGSVIFAFAVLRRGG